MGNGGFQKGQRSFLNVGKLALFLQAIRQMTPVIDPWVNLAVFKQQSEAQSLENSLRQHGFEVRTKNDGKVQFWWFLAPPRATFRVQVGAKDVNAVEEFFELDRSAGLLTERAIHCPACKSLKIEYPQMTRGFMTPTLLLDLGIIFRIIDHQAYCEECQYTWPLKWRRHSHPSAKKAAV